MINFDFLSTTVEWIERHAHTVDLLKWVAACLIAWTLGVFRQIREWARRPSISVNPTYSHCCYEKHEVLGNRTNLALLVFILDLSVINPTNSPLGVRAFELQVKRSKWLKRWSKPVPAIGFPSMPRTPMPGGAIKVVPLWFTTFTEYGEKFSLNRVDSHESSTGLVFFSAAMEWDEFPKKIEKCNLRITVAFATGEKRVVNAEVNVETGLEQLERRVPNSLHYVRHESTWTYCGYER